MKYILFVIIGIVFSGCATRPELEGREQAMRLQKNKPTVIDDLPLETLSEGITQNIERLKVQSNHSDLVFGPKTISRDTYILALEYLKEAIRKYPKDRVLKLIEEQFDFMEIYGDREWGEVFMTSYYDPVIQGSKKKTKIFSQPIYRTPDDLVSIQMHEFFNTFPRLREKMNAPHEQKSSGYVIRGRYVPNKDGMAKIVPFFSREEIDEKGSLDNKKLEMVWVKPVDSFFLQIQGSGVIELDKGERMRVGYAAQNGHPYVPIGRFLFDVIPREKMSMQAIQQHLESVSPSEMQDILNKNPSYVFFRPLETKSITYFGTEVVAGRTLATDYRFFPKGAIAYLEFERPEFGDDPLEAKSWEKTSRLVLDQDTGGAIRGAHRLDLYWGEGPEAARAAGVMRRHGKLFYLFPGEELLERLRSNKPELILP